MPVIKDECPLPPRVQAAAETNVGYAELQFRNQTLAVTTLNVLSRFARQRVLQ